MADPALSRRAARALSKATDRLLIEPGPERTAFVKAVDKAGTWDALAQKWRDLIVEWESL